MERTLMDLQTQKFLKAIVEQNIINSDYIRDRKDWLTIYRAIDAHSTDAKPTQWKPNLVKVGYLGAILVAGILSAHLFSSLIQ